MVITALGCICVHMMKISDIGGVCITWFILAVVIKVHLIFHMEVNSLASHDFLFGALKNMYKKYSNDFC